MNSVGLKKLCLGALFYLDSWGCAACNHWVISGWTLVLLFLIFGYFAWAAFFALLVLLFMMALIIYPAYEYTLKLSNKKLIVFLYHSDFHRRKRADLKRKISVIRVITLYADGNVDIIWKDKKIFGCDYNFIKNGVFLVKSSPCSWSIICDKFIFSKELGRKVGDFIFETSSSLKQKQLNFLQGKSFSSLIVDCYRKDDKFMYCRAFTLFKPLNKRKPVSLIPTPSFQHLLCDICGKKYLVGSHLNEIGIPMAYVIIAPAIIWHFNDYALKLKTDPDGAFNLPEQ